MTTAPSTPTRPVPALAYGGDYNPEQWPEEVWDEDFALMREAGVNVVTVGVFSWALLQPAADTFDFDWLDRVLDRALEAGVSVDLATATASPPPWLTTAHPEILPVTADGTTLWPGGRQGFCPSSPIFREHSLALCRAMAERYGRHEALVLWHVSNELGCHNSLCYCDVSAAAFRVWLRRRYDGDLGRLNHAWGTAFWSQRYTEWEQVLPPRVTPAINNPTQQLDFHRFSSDELLANFIAERDLLHELSPGMPVTTNFMVSEHIKNMDYLAWGREVDVVSNDHYLIAADPHNYRELAFASDLVRGTAQGKPWLLMETSTSAVNWQPRNIAKRPGELRRAALQHVGRGADGILFFQWRASQAGAEKYHSALLPHGGTNTRVWKEVVELGATLDRISELSGSVADNRVALLFDWNAWWACELDSHPSADLRYLDRAHDLHRSLTARGVGVDVVHPSADLDGYDVIMVPTLYLISDDDARSVAAAADRGASVVVTYFSGIVDEHDHVRLGGYPGAFRELLGIRVEEFVPLRVDEHVRLDDGSMADLWTEHLHLEGAEAIATYVDGPMAGVPALTRRSIGSGHAWYVATRTDQIGTDRLVDAMLAESGIPVLLDRRDPAEAGAEVTRRHGPNGQNWTCVVNHGDKLVTVPIGGTDLVTGERAEVFDVAGGDVAVIREG